MNIGVIFGSRSPEHDVSITSAHGIMAGITKHTDHTVTPIYITKTGQRIVDHNLTDLKAFKDLDTLSAPALPNATKNGDNISFGLKKKGPLGALGGKSAPIDMLWNMCHGENGEDGTVAAIGKILNVPTITPGPMAEIIGMNKHMMRQFFETRNLPVTKALYYTSEAVDTAEINTSLQYPLFVKPANCGSTIGISKVDNPADLDNAIEIAAHFDNEIIVEEGVNNVREFNCSIMEIDGVVTPSFVEEPQSKAEFLTFDAKYTSSDGATMKGAKGAIQCPANISEELTKEIQEMSVNVYKWMKVTGGAPRIDYLYDDKAQKLFINEINVIPGSMQIHLWKESGYSVKEFITNLINTANTNHAKSQKNVDFSSNIIDHTINVLDSMK